MSKKSVHIMFGNKDQKLQQTIEATLEKFNAKQIDEFEYVFPEEMSIDRAQIYQSFYDIKTAGKNSGFKFIVFIPGPDNYHAHPKIFQAQCELTLALRRKKIFN
ncbi:MAG: hypothetical protein WDN00_12610 [Limisphaerales bacterium]